MPWLTAGMLHDGKPGSYACLTLKAYSGRIFLRFLLVCIEILSRQLPDDVEIKMAYLATRQLDVWFHLQESAPRFLTQAKLA